MNPDDLNKKILYIPHPLFKVNKKSQYLDKIADEYFLLFGRILPYKQFHNVLIHWRSEKTNNAGESPSARYLAFE